MRESEVEKHFVWVVAMMGGKTWKTKSIGTRGFPDRVALLPNETWLVELKQPKGRLAQAQKDFAGDCARLNCRYACLWSIERVDLWVKCRAA